MTDKLIPPPCVQCGTCCTVGPCPFGKWAQERKQCSYLEEPNKIGQRSCGKYDEIAANPSSEMSPAFGGGCSSVLFNDKRWEIVEYLRKHVKKVRQRTEHPGLLKCVGQRTHGNPTLPRGKEMTNEKNLPRYRNLYTKKIVTGVGEIPEINVYVYVEEGSDKQN